MYKKGAGNNKQGKDTGNRMLCPYRNFSQAIIFRNPRDSLQISILARQLFPLNSENFLKIYKRAMHRAKGNQSRTISINAQYQVLFRNLRDSLQISILARQLCTLNSKDFLETYKRATQRPYGYLFCCFTQSCPD